MLWGQGFLFAFPADIPLASPMADFFINFPLSVLAGIGLWRMRQYGYVAAQIVAGFYIYASMLIFYLWPLRKKFFLSLPGEKFS